MKKSKSILAVLLVCMMVLFTACEGADNTSSGGDGSNPASREVESVPNAANVGAGGEGKYVEADVTPEGEEILDMLQMADGTLVLFTEGLTARYDSKDGGKTFTKTDWPGVTDGSLQNIRSLSMAEDGTLYGVKMDLESGAEDLFRVTAEGVVESVPIEELATMKAEGKMPYIHALQALSADKILLGFMDATGMVRENVSEDASESEENSDSGEEDDRGSTFTVGGGGILGAFDPNTGTKYYDLLGTMGFLSASVYGENFYLYGYDGAISVRSIETGEEIAKIEEAQQSEEGTGFSFSMSNNFAFSTDGRLFTQDSTGVYSQDKDTGEKSRLFEGASYSFGRSTNMAMQFYVAPENTFVMLVQENDATKVYRYEYDENAVTDPAKTLEIWSLEDNGTLRTAISDFLSKNSDAAVNLTIGKEEQGAQETADIIRNLNTRILAGDGPDIILLDGLPADSYAEKGMLTDLKQIVDFSDAYEQLLAPLERNGELNYFPARFKTSLLLTKTEQLGLFSDLESMVKAIESGNDKPVISAEGNDPFSSLSEDERPVFEFTDFNEMFDAMYPTSEGKIFENGSLNKGAAKEFLDALKRISDKYKLVDSAGGSGGSSYVVISSSGAADNETVSGNVVSYMNGRSVAGSFLLGNLTYLSIFESEDTEYAIMPGLTEGAYIPCTMMGICAGTDKEEIAAAFLQNMLADDVQGTLGGGFPITQKGFDAQKEEISKANSAGVELSDVTFDMQSFISLLKMPVITDQVALDAVKAAAEAYCGGKVVIDETVSMIEEATKLYLAEQQ